MPKKDVVTTHKLLNHMLMELSNQAYDEGTEAFDKMFGDKENVMSSLVKITTLLLKLNPVEKEFIKEEELLALGATTKELLIDVEFARQYAEASNNYVRD